MSPGQIKPTHVPRSRWLAKHKETSKPEVTFVRIAWESEAELVDELENCSHPRRLARRNCRKIIWDGMTNASRLTLHFLIIFVKDFYSSTHCDLLNTPPFQS